MKSIRINFLVNPDERMVIEKKARDYNFQSISEYMRFVALNSDITVTQSRLSI